MVKYSRNKKCARKHPKYLVAPSFLKKIDNIDQQYILLLICRTLCNNPHTKLIVWKIGSDVAQWVNITTDRDFLSNIKCDVQSPIDQEACYR